MSLPNIDSKRLKRVEDGFTVEPAASLGGKPAICDHCAREKCKIRNYVKRSQRAQMKVTTCKDFIPALGFSVLGGLDLPYWNTIRIGGAWARRLLSGHNVAIADTKNNKIVGYAEVESVHIGTLGQMIELHARMNHAIKHEIEHGKTLPVDTEIQARMTRILKNAHGTNIAAPDRQASVIYLMRERHADS